MKTIPSNLIEPLNAFLTSVNAAYEIYWKRSNFTYMVSPIVRVHTIGQKYAKLAQFEKRSGGDWSARSVYCFLDLTNGDLLKGTWKAPVAGAVRGNLKDVDLLKKFDIHGPCYLSGGGCFPSIYNELKNY